MKKIIRALSILLILVFSSSLLVGCGNNVPETKMDAITKLINADFTYIADNTAEDGTLVIMFNEKLENGSSMPITLYLYPTVNAAKVSAEEINANKENSPVLAIKNATVKYYGKWVLVGSEKAHEAFVK